MLLSLTPKLCPQTLETTPKSSRSMMPKRPPPPAPCLIQVLAGQFSGYQDDFFSKLWVVHPPIISRSLQYTLNTKPYRNGFHFLFHATGYQALSIWSTTKSLHGARYMSQVPKKQQQQKFHEVYKDSTVILVVALVVAVMSSCRSSSGSYEDYEEE